MICTVTLNPAFDKTVTVKDLIPHEVNVIIEVRFDPGGKGINVSRVLKELGEENRCLGIIGGDTGKFIKSYLEDRGIITDFVMVSQPTRTNLTVIDIGDPPETKMNELGPVITEEIILELEKKILDALCYSKFFVFAGSLPRGCPANTYCRLIDLVERRGATAILDTRDEALVEGIKSTPFMIKPNRSELGDILGRKMESEQDIIGACREFREKGVKMVVTSLGKDGAIMVCDDGVFKALPPSIESDSAVGSGDSLVAGICAGIQRKLPLSECLKLGVACGTATAMTPGTSLCTKAGVERILSMVKIEKLE